MQTIENSKYTILVVDDDVTLRKLFRKILTAKGYNVVDAPDGDEGLIEFKNRDIDVVIADIYMPSTSGIQLLEAIKNHKRYVPVIMVTGKPAVDTAVRCMKIGAADYLSKPLSVSKIEETVETVLSKTFDSTGYLYEPTDFIHKKFPVGYQIIDKIGDGGMGVVYLVKRIAHEGGHYALKIYKPEIFNTKVAARVRKRFLSEVESATTIQHQNVVKIHEFGLGEGAMANYIIMEYVAGTNLAQEIENQQDIELETKIRWLYESADALSAIHDAGICHRDVKPANILIDDNSTVKIADFGIAKVPGSNITSRFKAVGTPNYMAPEMFRGVNDDPRSDLFSLGITAYELLTGVHPFPGLSIPDLSNMIRTIDPPPPIRKNSTIPVKVNDIVEKLMQKQPTRRYHEATELRNELEIYREISRGSKK